MKKSITTRIRITKNKKLIRRKTAQGHFLAKKSSVQLKRKKRSTNANFLRRRIFGKPGTL
ncbi:hypothetical protein A2108_00760 [Candidatus Wolfebacteria bacterium GWA1_42_9]|uniref:50S ribosomal protein L35 n=1 Tax=Candidatus Wolfebacteria bacterium GWA1_42_9 TaxID=1802553 RepID=A0A1F8DL35_9BACT|nr:MAG: hypothetical protein A2108_00760 [Candidatus Wolfebacteria bacterium GWA1_42_9]